MNYWTQGKDNIYVAAHRGWCSKYPENTILAFKRAIELGVDQLELDVRVTKDGELVVIHDSTVDRTTNGKGRVRDLTLDELKALDAGIHKGEEFKGEKIPTFTELMELVKNHPIITIDIELKEYPTDWENPDYAYEVCDRILEIVERYNFGDRVVINSFSNPLNEYVYKKYKGKYRQHVFYPLSALCGEATISPYDYAYCACMFSSYWKSINISDKEEFDYILSIGVQPWAGAGIKDEASVDMAIENGAYLITCNNPDLVLDLLRKKGYHK
ncbi:MAG: hypothetical protein IJY41_04355 [Clostridia bacterium]|nr:hypothetical protein [Clostridia bacterium]